MRQFSWSSNGRDWCTKEFLSLLRWEEWGGGAIFLVKTDGVGGNICGQPERAAVMSLYDFRTNLNLIVKFVFHSARLRCNKAKCSELPTSF